MSSPTQGKRPTFPDIVVAVYGNGRCEARLHGCSDVIAEAPSTRELVTKLGHLYSTGFNAVFRDDPHM